MLSTCAQSDLLMRNMNLNKRLSVYLKILRIDHWQKNFLVLPGIVLAHVFADHKYPQISIILNFLLGGLGLCLVTSSNYVINEWLDRDYDKFHPEKKFRPSVYGSLQANEVYALYITSLSLGFFLCSQVNKQYLIVSLLLALMGAAYNVKPIRLKDVAIMDILSESFNNPIRMSLGYFMVTQYSWPAASALISYWTLAGIFLTLKRYVEFKKINNDSLAAKYRKSFKFYREKSLLIMAAIYATLSIISGAYFSWKTHPEYLLLLIVFLPFLGWYFKKGFNLSPYVEAPEKAIKSKEFMIWYLVLILSFGALSYLHF